MPRGGFSLVELVVATMIMSIGVLGLVSTSAVVSRMMGNAAQQTRAAAIAQTRFERLRSLRCNLLASGSSTTTGFTERWAVAQQSGGLYDVVDTVSYRSVRGNRSHAYRSVVRC